MNSFLEEAKAIFKSRKLFIPIIAVLFIPLLYSGMFLYAFWDPYAQLDDLPVAVVNLDNGAEYEGKNLTIGDDLVNQLKDNPKFKWEFVSEKKAEKGLENREYYMVIKIPKKFSENATTLLDENPTPLKLKYIPNESYNFLSAQIGETAVDRVKNEVANELTETYSKTIFENIEKMADGYQTASDGSAKLDDGAEMLSANLGTLKNGLGEMKGNIPSLVEGTKKTQAGVQQMQSELPGAVASEIEGELKGSIVKLNAGLDSFQSQLGAGLAEQITNEMIAAQSQQTEQLVQLFKAYGASDETIGKVLQTVQANAPTKAQVKQQVSVEINEGLNQGFSQYKAAVSKQLLSSTNGLEEKIATQTDPAFNALINGMTQITQGEEQLQDGAAKLYDGSIKLYEGSNELKSGTNELNEKLADAAKETADVQGDEKLYEMMADPVHLATEKVNEVPNYGTGFTPYFLSLGLFVGALLLSIVFPLRDPATEPKSAFGWFFGKFGIMVAAGIVQALLADIILLQGLDIKVQSPSLFILFSIITSLVFVSLIQFLVTTFSDAGRFIAIVILILQLTTSAGTFPLELIPSSLQHFNAWLPMTYTVSGFKAVISSGDFTFFWHNVATLFIFLVITLAGTITYFTIRFKKNNHRMTEELSEAV